MRKVLYILLLSALLGCAMPLGNYERSRTVTTETQESKNENKQSNLEAKIIRDYTAIPVTNTNSIVQDRSNITLSSLQNNSLESDTTNKTSDTFFKKHKISIFVALGFGAIGIFVLMIGWILFSKLTAAGKVADESLAKVGSAVSSGVDYIEDLLTEATDANEKLKLQKLKGILKK